MNTSLIIFQGRASRTIRVLLYPVGDFRPVLLHLPVRQSEDNDPLASCWLEDFDVSRWFPLGMERIPVHSIPSVDYTLSNRFTLVVSTPSIQSQVNRCLQFTLGIQLRGNVIAFRHSQRHTARVTNINYPDRRHLNLYMQR
ncbi:hypothetical protein C8Q76DRAFT_620778 [Earliella scabrosa]|nr:hypothetical protein C8Q76DRAFT_620778 [Earliella scabrosa]